MPPKRPPGRSLKHVWAAKATIAVLALAATIAGVLALADQPTGLVQPAQLVIDLNRAPERRAQPTAAPLEPAPTNSPEPEPAPTSPQASPAPNRPPAPHAPNRPPADSADCGREAPTAAHPARAARQMC